MSDFMTRGIHCRNPMDIVISNADWQGKVTPSLDQRFETFDCMENGIRAGAKLLLTYYNRHHLRTIRDIVTHYAPPSENATSAYIKSVSDHTGFDPDADTDLNDRDNLTDIVKAIIRQEQGAAADEITPAQIAEGIRRALA